MSAKRPPTVRKTAYIELDYERLMETGEAVPIGSPIIAPTISQKVPRGRFEVTYTGELFDVMRELGNKKIEVLVWLLSHKDGNNSINTTIRKIAEDMRVSTKTVNDAIVILKNAGLLKREGTVYSISPNLMVKGNQAREAYLMRKFEEIPDTKPMQIEDKQSGAIDAQIDGQLEIIDIEGNIGERAR